MTIKPIKRRKPRFALRVIKGGYTPADSFSAACLRKMHRVGDLVFAAFTKPRNPGFHRLAHQLGTVLVENLDVFTGMDSHVVLKRIQLEGNIGCDEIALIFPGLGPCSYRIPRSLSYESMDEAEFHATIVAMCEHVSRQYWTGVTPDKIKQMAELWVEAA